MRRSLVGVVLLGIALATIAVVAVVVRLLPSYEIMGAAGRNDHVENFIGLPGGSGGTVVDTPRFPDVAGATVSLQLATYARPASATVTIEALDREGRVLGRCVFPPAAYGNSRFVHCPVRASGRLRRLRVSGVGADGPLALFGVLRGRQVVAGRLERPLSGLGERLRVVWHRLGVPKTDLAAPPVLLLAFFASLALLPPAIGLVLLRGSRSD